MEKIKNKSNAELIEMQKKLKDEFEKVRIDLVKIYDYWSLIEKKYNEINNELNDRFGINNK
ncbi:MAG: hypothetical protein ACK5OW_01135 [bacterium]|jgi:hypothetical protein